MTQSMTASSEISQQGIFVSQTLPDISPRSHIIGLVGTTDWADLASPNEDGWFLSDFYLFNYLLRDLGTSRAWFTCVEPDFLIEKYTEFAHGNPYHTRRVVLDRDQRPTDVIVETSEGLLDAFLTYLRAECARAYAAQEPVFLLIFGHGDADTFGVEIGRLDADTVPLLSMESIKEILISMPGLRLSALLTSCCSGGWTTNVDMTAMSAAGPKRLSESWGASHSLGRCTGSIYTSALLEILQKEDLNTGSGPVPTSYREFFDQVRAKLLLLDKFGGTFDIGFSAQDDDWEREYHERTGIPLALYKQRLERLRTIPSTDREAHPYGDRTTDEQLSQWGIQPDGSVGPAMTVSLRGRCGGSDQALQSMMRKRVMRYFESHPGRDSLASNHTAHNLARRCLNGDCTFEDLARLEPILDYREKVSKLVDTLVTIMGLKPFIPSYKWDESSWPLEKPLADSIHRKIILSKLIPKPATHQGRYSNKPSLYLTAAFMEHHLSEDEVDQRLEIGKAWAQRQVEQVKLHLDRTSRGRMGSWMESLRSLKHRVRSLSPRKRGTPSRSETSVH